MADIRIKDLPSNSSALGLSRIPVDEFDGTNYITKYYTVSQFIALCQNLGNSDLTQTNPIRNFNGANQKLNFNNLSNLLLQVNNAGTSGLPSVKVVGFGVLNTETVAQIENHLGIIMLQIFGNGYTRIDGGIGVGGTSNARIFSTTSSNVNNALYAQNTGNGTSAYIENTGGGNAIRAFSQNAIALFAQTALSASDAIRADGAFYGATMGLLTTRFASALMQLDSTTQGFLMPRMTSAQRAAIVSPPEGLEVFDTTLGIPMFFASTLWRSSQNTGATALQDATVITTTSTADVLMSGMQFTGVPDGTYLFSFRGQFSSGTNNTITSATIYINGVAQPISVSQQGMGNSGTPNQISTQIQATLTGTSNTVEIRWRTSGGTLTSQNKSFTKQRVI